MSVLDSSVSGRHTLRVWKDWTLDVLPPLLQELELTQLPMARPLGWTETARGYVRVGEARWREG